MFAAKKLRILSAPSLLFAARIGGAAAMFGAQILLARLTSADTLALYFLATSLVTVAGTVATLGYPYIVTAFMGRYHDGRHAAQASAFVALSRFDGVIAGALLALVLAAGILVYPGLGWPERIAFLVALPAIPAIALSRTNGAVGRARALLATAYLPTILWRPLFFFVLAAIAAAIFHLTDAVTFVALFALIAIGSALTQGFGLRRGDGAVASADRRLSRLWRRAALPFIAISIAELLIVDIDLLLAGAVLPRKELAVFAVCIKLAFFAGFVVDVIYELIAPELARCYARRDEAAVQRNVVMANLAASGSALAMLAGAAVLGHFALSIFGPDYVAGEPVLLTLLAVPAVNAFAGPHVALLTLRGIQRRMTAAYAAGGAVLVALTVTLAGPLGMLGAALAVLAAYVTLNLVLAVMVWRAMGLRSDVAHALRAILAGKPQGVPRVAS